LYKNTDIERVITWKFPINKDVGDIWQRIGRGGRGQGRSSQCIVQAILQPKPYS